MTVSMNWDRCAITVEEIIAGLPGGSFVTALCGGFGFEILHESSLVFFLRDWLEFVF